jgi:hypothetical protein
MNIWGHGQHGLPRKNGFLRISFQEQNHRCKIRNHNLIRANLCYAVSVQSAAAVIRVLIKGHGRHGYSNKDFHGFTHPTFAPISALKYLPTPLASKPGFRVIELGALKSIAPAGAKILAVEVIV